MNHITVGQIEKAWHLTGAKQLWKLSFARQQLGCPSPWMTERDIAHMDACDMCQFCWPWFWYFHVRQFQERDRDMNQLENIAKQWLGAKEETRRKWSLRYIREIVQETKRFSQTCRTTSYNMFVSERFEGKQITPEETKECTRAWNHLTHAQKARYKEKAEKKNQERKAKLQSPP